jgi:predicted CoA-binding protein
VFVKSGPGPQDFNPRPPEQVDVVYAYRPVAELPTIVGLASELGARTVWLGVELSDEEAAQARATVEAAGLGWLHHVV